MSALPLQMLWRSTGMLALYMIFGLMILVSACAPTEELKDEEMEELLDEAYEEYSDLAEHLDDKTWSEREVDDATIREMEERAEELLAELPELSVNLENYRSSFTDQQTVFRNEVPDIYLQTIENDRQTQRNRGYRIQIISTQDARLAEEIREDFEDWISSVSAPPHARTYMEFQQPNYRVHVGNFSDRENAMEFTEFVRLRFPDAWVVHSQIDPARVMR